MFTDVISKITEIFKFLQGLFSLGNIYLLKIAEMTEVSVKVREVSNIESYKDTFFLLPPCGE